MEEIQTQVIFPQSFDWIKFGLAVLGSSLLSALLNISWNIYSKKQDKKDKERRDQIEIDHEKFVALNWIEGVLISMYESSCSIQEYLNNIEHYARDYHPKQINTIEEPDGLNFKILSVSFRSKVNLIQHNYKYSNDFIFAAAEYWADHEECYNFELQRLAFYGVELVELLNEYRHKDHRKFDKLTDAEKYFIENKDKFIKNCRVYENMTFLPEIKMAAFLSD